jgi:hypothetical protein
MDKEAMTAQFSNLKPSDQVVVLLRVCFNLTIVSRDVFASESPKKIEYAKNVSEMYHKILSGIISRVRQKGVSYPDDVLIGMLHGFLMQFNLEPYFHHIWEDAFPKPSE